MIAPENLLLLAVIVPFIGALAIPLFSARPNLREAVTLVTAVALLSAVCGLFPAILDGARPEVFLFAVAPGLAVAFSVEPLGMLFALVASSLWIVNSIYSIGYMRAHDEPRQTGFYVCFAIALGSTIGIAFAANLFTLFLFYEALTLSTFSLVTHKRSAEAMRAGRLYLLLLLGSSMLLFLPAIIATWMLAGTLDFTPGGILAGTLSPFVLGVLLALFVFGIGKAAVMPLHFWLPAAMVAPTPVSALLHAVAVVKAGVFCIVKVIVYIFGIDTLSQAGANDWLIYVGCASLLLASFIALKQKNLKARLAYSTVSQLAYVVVGAALATSAGIIGSGLQIAMHAAGKITLFFCAGAIYIACHKTEISELDGIGRRMPITMTAFFIGSLSIIGLPPFGGMWSKWYLALGALEADKIFVVGVLMLSSLLSAAYLLPIPLRAFFAKTPDGEANTYTQGGIHEAPIPCLIALSATAIGCLLLFFFAAPLYALCALIPLR
ncbi:MAG: monovalent cation/H+ antiporter subunit D family protein [Proteobacteria bacterium]|nr:monovalent cation/H+ antiporter subunit D family protein [Pseudomonadota bacterium]